MDIFQKITIVNCVMSSLTLLIVTTALLPHFKDGMVVVRDACLWVAFVLLALIVAWFGWHRLSNAPASETTDQVELDPGRTWTANQIYPKNAVPVSRPTEMRPNG